MPGRFACGCPQVRSFHRSPASLAQCDASMDRFLPQRRFCVPPVTITFKTWVFRNFAMERPSRLASFESSDSQNSRMDAGPMLRRVKLMNPFEIVQDLVTQDRITPERQQAAAGRAEGRQSGRPFHAGLRRLRFRRHHLPRHRAMEQRGAGMAARQHLQPAGALQHLPARRQPGVADAELSAVRWPRNAWIRRRSLCRTRMVRMR